MIELVLLYLLCALILFGVIVLSFIFAAKCDEVGEGRIGSDGMDMPVCTILTTVGWALFFLCSGAYIVYLILMGVV